MAANFELRETDELASEDVDLPLVHLFGKDHNIICDTDRRGHPSPRNKTPFEIVLDASEGFIPLWEKGTKLRWRFQERTLRFYKDAAAVKTEIRQLLGQALLAWGDAAPVKFKEDDDAWDFEIVVRNADQCERNACVMASAFFPDAGRHEFVVYPRLFRQSRKEQIDTFIHETGHIFGLRHFFANVSETAWPSEIFGEHERFTIMNYGHESELTSVDKEDLKRLYQAVWRGELTNINGTPIRLVKPYHASGRLVQNLIAARQIQVPFQPDMRGSYTGVT